jgi:hypothetical protein
MAALRNLLILLDFSGEPSGTRTRDPLIKSQMLYRPELTAHEQGAYANCRRAQSRQCHVTN